MAAQIMVYIGSGNGLLLVRRQVIMWPNAYTLSTGLFYKLKRNFNQHTIILIDENAFENIACKMLSIRCVNGHDRQAHHQTNTDDRLSRVAKKDVDIF